MCCAGADKAGRTAKMIVDVPQLSSAPSFPAQNTGSDSKRESICHDEVSSGVIFVVSISLRAFMSGDDSKAFTVRFHSVPHTQQHFRDHVFDIIEA